MKVAFYVANKGTWIDKAINVWSSVMISAKHMHITKYDGFSHCEIIFSDGTSFSSSPRDGGTRFKEITYDLGKWVFVDIPSQYSEEEIRSKAEELSGKSYDFIGVFLHEALPLNIDDPNSWWCSEIVCYLLGIHKYKISPNLLYTLFLHNMLTYERTYE